MRCAVLILLLTSTAVGQIKCKTPEGQHVAHMLSVVGDTFYSVCGACGQETSKTFTLPQGEGTYPVPRSIIHPIWTPQQRPIYLSDLSQFLEECWNDSTLFQETRWLPCKDESTCWVKEGGHVHDVAIKTYTHRLENSSAMEVMREFEKWMRKR